MEAKRIGGGRSQNGGGGVLTYRHRDTTLRKAFTKVNSGECRGKVVCLNYTDTLGLTLVFVNGDDSSGHLGRDQRIRLLELWLFYRDSPSILKLPSLPNFKSS